MHLVDLLHQSHQLKRAKHDQFIHGGSDIFVFRTDVLLFGDAALLKDTVERFAFVVGLGGAVQHAEKNEGVGHNLPASILKDFRVYQPGYARLVILELRPGCRVLERRPQRLYRDRAAIASPIGLVLEGRATDALSEGVSVSTREGKRHLELLECVGVVWNYWGW